MLNGSFQPYDLPPLLCISPPLYATHIESIYFTYKGDGEIMKATPITCPPSIEEEEDHLERLILPHNIYYIFKLSLILLVLTLFYVFFLNSSCIFNSYCKISFKTH